MGLTTRHTVQEPTNGVAYIFEVWAVNAAGAGDTTRVGVGTITLSSLSPRVGVPLRSTLMDPDEGEIDVRWDRSFTSSTSLRDPTAERASGALTTTFTPGRWNVGSRMQVEAFYDDAQGRGQRAYSVKTAPVQDRLEVSYESATYQALEGGSSVSIRVRLSGPDDRALTIPIKVRAGDNTESGDYAVKGLINKQLLFPAGTIEKSFTIRALADPDSADETVLLSFGALPAGVVAVGTTRRATVRLLDDDDPAGVVSLSSLSPQEGSQLTATLSDASGGISSATWQWQRRQGSLPWTNAAGTSLELHPWISIYTPQSGDVGHFLRATVSYTDADGPNQSAESTATNAVRAAPPVHLTASGGDGQVALRWTVSAHSATIAGYQVRQRISDSAQAWSIWATVSGGTTARNTTVPGLTNGVTYQFQVQAIDSQDASVSVSNIESATPQGALAVEVWFGSATYSAQEGAAGVSITVELSASPSQTLSIPVQVSKVGDTEASDYTVPNLTADGTLSLSFGAADRSQSFEITANEDADSDDETVSLSFGTLPAGVVAVGTTRQATVRLLDNDGVVSLSSPSPQEDSQLTATLTDASGGISSATWQWQRRQGSLPWTNAAGTPLELHPWISIYTPQSGDVGHFLRATVSYTDADGPNQSAESTATNAVRAAPPVHLTASGGDGQVALRWTVSAHSATIAGYQVRQRISDSAQAWSSWATVPGGISVRSKTITGLTNGVTYQFQVQAIDSQGTSVAVSDIESATPAAVPDAPPHFMPFPGDGQVVLEWEAAANNGSRITHYEVQSRQVSDPAQAWSSWSPVSGGRSARDTTMTGLTNGQRYEFAVRAVNGVGNGASIAQAAMPRALSLTASGGDGQVGLRWTFSAHSATIAHYQVRQRISDSAQDWSIWATVSGGTTARNTTVPGLTNGVTYQFQVQAIDSQDASVSVSNIESATPQGALAVEVWFGSATYSAQEGAAGVSITVELSASPSQTLSIPVQVSKVGDTEAGDYTVPNLTAEGTVSLSFGATDRSQSFTITANEDADSDDETVSLTFGTLPSGVVAVGTTRQATVTLLDNDDPAGVVSLSSPSPQEDSQLTATLTDASGGISSATWQWQRRQGSLPWTNAAGTSLELHPWISIYTPQSGDVGHFLRATVSYDDADGPNQRAQSTATEAVRPTVETQYAYRAWQTAPLFDAVASGPPDNWSSSDIPWTDAAPRVWRIGRTRPSGGNWSEWGGLEKYSERPVAQPDPFYRRAVSQPDTPGNTTSSATPTNWLTSNPGATATQGV